MKNFIKIPRILSIKTVEGFKITCIFNNGETRIIDFTELFRKWDVKKTDPEFILTDVNEFKNVWLRNSTLSWKNVKIILTDFEGNNIIQPFELSPDLLFKNSIPILKSGNRFYFGTIIKKLRLQKGMTQLKLAEVSGTSKTYISRVENDLIEPELSTLYKIVEIGLGKRLRIDIK